MEASFGASSTSEDVLAGVDLRGRRVLVTGISSGLGLETARALAAHGAEVVGTVRDAAAPNDALSEARAGAREHGGSLQVRELDLGALASIRALASQLVGEGRPFDLVIANAGVMATPFGHTADGFETQFGVNHLGHFVLVNRIAPLMPPGARPINVSSAGHRFADVDIADPNFERTPYDPYVAYGRSKTALILFAVEFDRRHKDEGLRAAAVHPGAIVTTRLARHQRPEQVEALVDAMNADLARNGKPAFEWKSIPQGAATAIWAGVVADADEIGGHYCENCHVTERITYEPLSLDAEGVRPYAVDPNHARALWTESEHLVGERFPA
jgi:NAD(P)-dependent dehydrogenase (short-subunit alcohol dehydrogenase family)